MVGPRPPWPQSGFSIVELAISTALLGSLTGAILMATTRASATYAQSAATGDLNARSARAIHRISRELIGARWSTLNPTPASLFDSDTDSLEFERPLDTAGGSITWAARRRIELQPQAGELDNGLDDNGNGLIDEQSVVLVENAGLPDERRTVLVNGISALLEGELPNAVDDNGNGLIDERGLSFSFDDGKLVLRITLQHVGPGGRVMSRTQTVDLVMRNRG